MVKNLFSKKEKKNPTPEVKLQETTPEPVVPAPVTPPPPVNKSGAPSNAPAGYPEFSPDGYAYFYPIGGDGLPTGTPWLQFDGQNFPNTTEIANYKLAKVRRDENLRKLESTADVPSVGFPVFDAGQVSRLLASFDAAVAAGREDLAWYHISQAEKYALQNRGMKSVAINSKINQYADRTPEGYNESAQAEFRKSLGRA
jgi:hypothetical protein